MSNTDDGEESSMDTQHGWPGEVQTFKCKCGAKATVHGGYGGYHVMKCVESGETWVEG